MTSHRGKKIIEDLINAIVNEPLCVDHQIALGLRHDYIIPKPQVTAFKVLYKKHQLHNQEKKIEYVQVHI